MTSPGIRRLARVIVDTNLLVSYLLSSSGRNAPTVILEAAINGSIILLLAEEIVREIRRKVATKPYLAQRINAEQVDRLWSSLTLFAEFLPPLTGPVPQHGRDRDDDYLLALAEQGRADYLVTRDKDLLDLATEPFPFRIVSPGEFIRALGLG